MRRTTLEMGPGVVVRMDGETYCVKQWATSDSVLMLHIESSDERIFSLSSISECLGCSQVGPQIDLTEIEPEQWDEAVERFQSLMPVLWKPARTRREVVQIAESMLVSTATTYRWIQKIETYGTITCLLRKARADKGKKRCDDEVEKILYEVISCEFMTSLKKSPTLTLREVRRRCYNNHLREPSMTTLKKRINEILPEERERRRNGRNAALDCRAHKGSIPNIDRLHALWQIDHTLVDIELVDEKDRIAIGRPWITVAIDVFSRMVVGWYVSFDPPGTLGTGICISNAILPKDELLARLGVRLPWPCQGKPGIIHTDNAREFRGKTLKMACREHGFDMMFRKVKEPQYGAHIERLLGTLAKEIHGLEGTTFSNPQERGEYDSQRRAVMTLDDFERWLANLVLGVYHQREHSTLECPPIKRYQDGIFGTEEFPGIGYLPMAADPEKLRMDFLPFEVRTIQPYGVVLDNIKYHDAVLDKWIGATAPNSCQQARKFVFRRDPRNISVLYFWDPDIQCYFKIPYRDSRRPAISLWELRRIHSYLTGLGKKDIDEDMIFSTWNEMRRIEENATELTRKQRRDQERSRRHMKLVPSALPKLELVKDVGGTVPSKEKPIRRIDPALIVPYDEIEPV